MDSEVRQDRRGARPGQQGQQPFVPTDQMRADVRSWIKIDNAANIADYLGISRDTLDRHFRRELSHGRFEARAVIGGKLVAKAMAGNLDAAKFYLRTQGGWSAKFEHTGPNGGAIRHIDLSGFLEGKTEEELVVIEALIEQLIAAGGGDNFDGDAGGGAPTD